jgi:hypothetical protein
VSELSISERFRPHKERIAKANAQWEALKQARASKSVDLSGLKMRVRRHKNEISIIIVDPSGDTAQQETAIECVMSLLRTLGVEVLESDDTLEEG